MVRLQEARERRMRRRSERNAEQEGRGSGGGLWGQFGGRLGLPERWRDEALTEEQVVNMMESHPEAFQQLLQSMVQQEPRLGQVVQSDPAMLVQLLTEAFNSSITARQSQADGGSVSSASASGSAASAVDKSPNAPSELEVEAMISLEAMFPQIPATQLLQALRAAGGDPNLAASLLFDS